MSPNDFDAQWNEFCRQVEPLLKERAVQARIRYQTAKDAKRRGVDWKSIQERWDQNRRRELIPPLRKSTSTDDLYGLEPEWWREQP